jgi:2-polyprenyl-3-methyl-5-hydroxy-6-metoxy-1,4-benzoquinol methylase
MSNSSNVSIKSVALAFGTGLAAGAYLVARMHRKEKEDPAKKAAHHLLKVAEYSTTGSLIRVCDKLQLYDALWESGPSTAAELAQKMNCNERWLTEILSQATAAGICVYFFGKFCLKPEYAHLLRDPTKSQRSMQGLFDMLPLFWGRTDATVQAVQSGVGLECDLDIHAAADRMTCNWFETKLEEDLLQKVTVPKSEKNLVTMLEEGIKVADIGVGLGSSALYMAKRFPKSSFCVYEASDKARAKIQERVNAAKLTNITVCNTAKLSEGPSKGGSFDLIYAQDIVHHLTEPKKFLKEAKKTLSPDGCMVVVDIACSDVLKDNIARPDAALYYGISCFWSLHSATSKKTGDGAGLGIFGFPQVLAKSWVAEEGFTFFAALDVESLPEKSCYILA